ncbi:MAG TPA: O-methyltransferase [Thermoanaerobaculia bacterium]|nr:O-methyltransferase [Thermoanaerobaculia bacterium]
MKDRADAILQKRQAAYLDSLVPSREPILAEIERIAAEQGQPIADPEVGHLLRLLVRMRAPARVLEIGTNLGYSVVVMGRELPPSAVLETIEIDRGILASARELVGRARLVPRVEFHQGAALDVLPRLDGPFDLVWIDCVKQEYPAYLEALFPKLAPGAVIVADNVLWKGRVADGESDPATDGIRLFNARIMTDPRLVSSILPLGDGVSLSVVR